MSRSRKKTPFFSPCKGHNDSDKFDKQLAHRGFRAKVRVALQTGRFEVLPIRLTEARNIYDFVSDGPKMFWRNFKSKSMRK